MIWWESGSNECKLIQMAFQLYSLFTEKKELTQGWLIHEWLAIAENVSRVSLRSPAGTAASSSIKTFVWFYTSSKCYNIRLSQVIVYYIIKACSNQHKCLAQKHRLLHAIFLFRPMHKKTAEELNEHVDSLFDCIWYFQKSRNTLVTLEQKMPYNFLFLTPAFHGEERKSEIFVFTVLYSQTTPNTNPA